MLELVESWLQVRPQRRAAEVETWWAAQTDPRAAARGLAEALELLEGEPLRQDGANARTAQLVWLEAEGMRHPLDAAAEAAEAAGDREIAAQLWTHAANSALMLGELADLPYAYARRAVLTGSTDDRVWEAFTASMVGYTTGFFEDIEGWLRGAADGEPGRETLTRVLAAAERCARDWDDDDRERLAEVRGA